MAKSLLHNLVLGGAILLSAATPVFAEATPWEKQVSKQIAAKQTYPRMAQMRGEEGTARVKIYVGADGSVQRTELVAPSGSIILDREALALPQKAGTLPTPPAGPTTVTLPFTWKLI